MPAIFNSMTCNPYACIFRPQFRLLFATHVVRDLPRQLLHLLGLAHHFQGEYVFARLVHILLQLGGNLQQLRGVLAQKFLRSATPETASTHLTKLSCCHSHSSASSLEIGRASCRERV